MIDAQSDDLATLRFKVECKKMAIDIRHSKNVFLIANGAEDTVWVQITKKEAKTLVNSFVCAGFQSRTNDDGDCVIGAKY